MKPALRKLYIKKYGGLYQRASVPMDECVYCSGPRQCLDHCPPISKLPNIDLQAYQKAGGKLVLYPSCLDCNAILSNKFSIDLIDRMNTLVTYYIKKLDKIEIWTERELAELGPSLRSLISHTQAKAGKYQRKLTLILERIDAQMAAEDEGKDFYLKAA